MKKRTDNFQRIAGFPRAIVCLVLMVLTVFQVQAEALSTENDRDILEQIQSLYGLDQNQALERLAREEIAAEVYLRIRSLELASYAGAWFDGETLGLQVAVTEPADHQLIEWLGGQPLTVTFSLSELEAARANTQTQLSEKVAIRESHIDYKTNRVVIGVASDQIRLAERTISALGREGDKLRIIESKGQVLTSSGPVRGGNGTRNYTWQQQEPNHPSYPFPCSIGASVEGGYVTAGHCGLQSHEMRTPAGQILGTIPFQGSTHLSTGSYQNGEDGAWVETVSAWTPSPQINGYDHGIFSIPASWAGMLESPVGATVCRYGQTTAKARCGAILAKDVDFPSYGLYGFSTADGEICTEYGDSGGPFVTASGQMQGTNSGGVFPIDPGGNTCPGAPPIICTFNPFVLPWTASISTC
jgi:streptogrisin C